MPEQILFIDFETRSHLDLKKSGLWRYSHDDSTDIWCLGFAFGDEEPRLIYFRNGMIEPQRDEDVPRIAEHVRQGRTLVAHNAQFEHAIWTDILSPRYGFPEVKLEQWRCTLAECYAMGLPGSLEAAAQALGLGIDKDDTGRQLMLRMCKPDKHGRWVTDGGPFTFLGETVTPEWAVQRLGEYCAMDVAVERGVYERTMRLSAKEHRIWCMDQRINRRGVLFDPDAVDAALEIRDATVADLNEQISELTDGAVQATTNVSAIKEWLADYGIVTDTLAKNKLNELLADETVPDLARRVLQLRKEAGRATSVSKLEAIKRQAGDDGRVRYLYQYHGAHTGRWAGRSIQPHNITRDLPEPEKVEEIMALVAKRDRHMLEIMYGSPLTTISMVLRGFIVAEDGSTLVGGDWSNIEGRGLAWLAGEDWKLRAFREADAGLAPDIYIQSYSRAFGVPIDQIPPKGEERQLGKVMELALGFQGGKGAFKSMAATYDVAIPSDERCDQIKHAWRQVHPRIKAYWYEVQGAALSAVRSPGSIVAAGAPGRRVKYRKYGSFLWCLLPSGRALCYPYPQIHQDSYGDFLTYRTVPDSQTWGAFTKAKAEGKLDKYHGPVVDAPDNSRLFYRVATYGGRLAENNDQGICRDVLAESMLVKEERGYQVVKHVHDEAIVEGVFKERDREAVEAIMQRPPDWAEGFPLAADCWLSKRYRKE